MQVISLKLNFFYIPLFIYIRFSLINMEKINFRHLNIKVAPMSLSKVRAPLFKVYLNTNKK